MSKRKYREASRAKRLNPDDIAPDFSQAEYLAADLQYNREKTDPAAHQQQLHDQIQHQQRMLRILGSAV